MTPMRPFFALLALLVALAASGCGSEQVASDTGASADVAPKGAAVWVSLDTDTTSAQWAQLTGLIDRIPGAAKAFDAALADVGDGVDWERDVLPALGPEVVLTVPAGSPGAVVLTQPDDEAKLAELIAKSDGAVSAEVDGWTAVGESQKALDAYLEALDAGSLADDPAFGDAVSGLPEEAVARIYVDGEGLDGLAGRAAQAGSGIVGQGGAPSVGVAPAGAAGALGRLALALSAEQDGLRLTGSVDPEGALPESFAPTLLERVPADALAAVVFQGGDLVRSQLDGVAGSAELGRQLEQGLGISLQDVAELFANQGVVYVRPGAPIPEVTLALEGAGARGQQVIGKVVEGIGAFAAAFGGSAAALRPVTTAEDGVEVTKLELQPGVAVRWGSVDGTLVVTTGAGGIRTFRGDGAKLVDSEAFARAAADVKLGERTSGFVYADVDALVPLLEGLAELDGVSADDGMDELLAALEAIDSLAVNTTAGSDALSLDGFLRVR
jgi:hypothetical protein